VDIIYRGNVLMIHNSRWI